ncbi:MAG: hypothetical protein DRG78_04670 [Epsilonproteobacteria bacterium]|nr:MAG: hypothetical protein DRG78_04670 [Campylobacterota bacterium]
MGLFNKKEELTIETIRITKIVAKVTNMREANASFFVCVEDSNINGTNIKEYVLEELKKFENCNTLSEFQRTPFGFCGMAIYTR